MEITIMRAARSALAAAGNVPPRSLFFTPHENFMPTGVRGRAIGIKDSGSTRELLADNMVNMTFKLSLTCWVPMTHLGEEALLDDDGVMRLAADTGVLLDENRLGLPQVLAADLISSSESTLFFTDNNQALVKKSLVIEYDIEFERSAT